MKLSIPDLVRRHSYWKREIASAGIWEESRFKPVKIEIRKHHKTNNGLFQRRWKVSDKAGTLVDKIIIYNNSEDFDESFINSVLVHEMIHQYIIQNDISDTSTHGKVFKSFMETINDKYGELLHISVKSNNPRLKMKGEGMDSHLLLIMKAKAKFYCCVVNPKKAGEIDRKVKSHRKIWEITSHQWMISNDVYFSHFRRCTTAIHGICKPLSEFENFIEEYSLKNP